MNNPMFWVRLHEALGPWYWPVVIGVFVLGPPILRLLWRGLKSAFGKFDYED